MYFNVNFNVFFKLIKVHLLVSELYITHATYRMTWTAGDQRLRELILYRHLRRTTKSDC